MTDRKRIPVADLAYVFSFHSWDMVSDAHERLLSAITMAWQKHEFYVEVREDDVKSLLSWAANAHHSDECMDHQEKLESALSRDET